MYLFKESMQWITQNYIIKNYVPNKL